MIPREVPRDFHVIWPTAVVKQSPIHWFGGLTRYVEVLWRTTNELRVGVLGIERGGSDLTLDYARANSSMPRPLEHAKATRVRSSRLEHARVQHCHVADRAFNYFVHRSCLNKSGGVSMVDRGGMGAYWYRPGSGCGHQLVPEDSCRKKGQ